MNDNILTALMQLSALVAQINQTHFNKNAHVLVKSYLEKSLGPKNIRNHLKQFFDFSKQYEEKIETLVLGNNTESNLQIINKLCESLNKELTVTDRYILMLSFLELIYIDKKITHEEQEFISILASKFKIDNDDFVHMCDFIFNQNPQHLDSKNYAVICDNEAFFSEELEGSWITKNKPTEETYHIIHFKGIKDKIFIHKFNQTDLLIMKYSGDTPVTLSNNIIERGKFYIITIFDQLLVNNKLVSIYDIYQKLSNDKNSIPLILKGKDVVIESKNLNSEQPCNFSFCEEAGNIVALLGKHKNTSAYIQRISGRNIDKKQDICLNGYKLFSEYFKVQKLIGYLPDYDIFDENISVYQNIYLNCKLSFPKYSKDKIQIKVQQIIETLKLSEIQDWVPAKNKELFDPLYHFLTNLAIEFTHDPWLLFIETSLDKLTIPDYEIVLKILRNFASGGKLVFITSSHPNSITFEYCNKLWIIDDQNYLIYNGSTHFVFDYFEQNSNNILPKEEKCSFCGSIKPELLNQIINQKLIDDKGEETTKRKITPYNWYQLYKNKLEPKINLKECRKVLPLHSGSAPTINQQFSIYFRKKILSQKNLISNWFSKLGIFVFGSIILSLLFRSDWTSNYLSGTNPNLHIFILFSIIVMLILGAVISENENHLEKKKYSHELKKNLSFFSYLNGQLTWLLLESAIFCTIYTLISTFILGITEYLPKYLILLFTVCSLGNITGILFSNLFSKRKIVYFALLVVVIFNVLFNGITINIKSFPKVLSSEQYTPVITEISPVKWAFEALYVEHAINNDFEKLFYDLDQKIEVSIFNANYLIPELQKKFQQILLNPDARNNKKVLSAIHGEIKNFENNSDIFPFEYINELGNDSINPAIIKEANDYLTYIQLILSEKIADLTQKKRNLEHSLIDSIGKNNYQLFKKQHFNSYLYDIANKFNTAINVKFDNGNIVKNMNPLYLVPSSNFGRAHLFAPVKLFNYFYYNTYWFNLFILWWFTFIAFILTIICYPLSKIL